MPHEIESQVVEINNLSKHTERELSAFIEELKRYSRDLVVIFPRDTEFSERAFKLRCDAYIDSRYSLKYTVTTEEFKYMMERIAYYESMVEEK